MITEVRLRPAGILLAGRSCFEAVGALAGYCLILGPGGCARLFQ
jgi:hypothetical protein